MNMMAKVAATREAAAKHGTQHEAIEAGEAKEGLGFMQAGSGSLSTANPKHANLECSFAVRRVTSCMTANQEQLRRGQNI